MSLIRMTWVINLQLTFCGCLVYSPRVLAKGREKVLRTTLRSFMIGGVEALKISFLHYFILFSARLFVD